MAELKLIRLSSLSKTEAARIRYRQRHGTMTEHYDADGYICYDAIEFEHWRPKKGGRPPLHIQDKKI